MRIAHRGLLMGQSGSAVLASDDVLFSLPPAPARSAESGGFPIYDHDGGALLTAAFLSARGFPVLIGPAVFSAVIGSAAFDLSA